MLIRPLNDLVEGQLTPYPADVLVGRITVIVNGMCV